MLVQIGQHLGPVVTEHQIEGGNLARIDIRSSDAALVTTCGWIAAASSMTAGSMLCPLRMIKSLARPEMHKAIGRNGAEVTRDEPSVFGEGGGSITEIAREDVWAAYHQHPALA
jgi:hypothetical protein